MVTRKFTRRRFLKTTAAASAAVGFTSYVRTSHAAGKLELGFWDHWVPGANDVLRGLADEWAAKEKVDLQIDFITSSTGSRSFALSAGHQVGNASMSCPALACDSAAIVSRFFCPTEGI